MNVNSIPNKLIDLKILISDLFDILCLVESRLGESFLNSEIALKLFKKPYRLDVTETSSGWKLRLLVYVEPSLLSKTNNLYDFHKDIQCITMGLNVSNKKYIIFLIYRPPNQSINHGLDRLSEGLGFFLKHYKNICILGNFNATLSNPYLKIVLENQNVKNLIKNPTCFKSSNGSARDLILTNSSYLNLLKQELVITTI